MAAVTKDPADELEYAKPSDATRIREMLGQLKMSQAEGARALDISERMMRYYCAGEVVPRVVLLALERLVDLKRQVGS